jgi:hypothetical protein
VKPHDFVEPVRTERMILRLLTTDDVDDVHAWQGDEDTCRYMLHEPRSREEVAEKIT